MLVIRLFRTGKKNQPFYKIVVTDKKNASHGGRFVESLGYLNPLTKEKSINGERAKYWISVGAKPSDTVYNFLIKNGVLEGKKISVHKVKPKKEESSKTENEVVKKENIEEKIEPEKINKEEVIEEKKEEKPSENENQKVAEPE